MSASPNATRKTLFLTVGVVVFMGAMGFASVPLYDLFCRVTGYGGETSTATAGSDEVLDETVTVRFDGTLERDMPWTFEPEQRQMEVRLGETNIAFYKATNPTDEPIAGQASYNVAPFYAGNFFVKIDCFCFTEQVLQPGESVDMPVTFYVDPDMLEDRDAKYVDHITLSYTFYQIDVPEDYASLEPESVSADR